MKRAWQLFAALTVWVLLALVVLAGIALGLASLVTGRTDYISRVFKMTDRTAAAVLGYTGENTVSKECGRSSCRACKLLCLVLGIWLAQPDHCKQEAR